jgi:hypothetical protein
VAVLRMNALLCIKQAMIEYLLGFQYWPEQNVTMM